MTDQSKDAQYFAREGSAIYGQLETAIAAAIDGAQKLAKLHLEAYQHGHQAGIDALTGKNNALSIVGDLAVIYNDVLAVHQRDLEALKASGGKPVGNYKELPDLLVPQPKSGTGR